jgi:hypothetical protein
MDYVNPLSPTFNGYITTLHDAQILVECCLRGLKKPAYRRLDGKEQEKLIQSGHVFVFEEESSKILRWTDGRSWSRGRKEGDSLLYTEVEPEQKTKSKAEQKAKSKVTKRKNGGISKPELSKRAWPSMHQGLRKRCIVITLKVSLSHPRPSRYHIISYFTSEEIKTLTTPSRDPSLQNISPRSDITGQTSTPGVLAPAKNSRGPAMVSAVGSTYVPGNYTPHNNPTPLRHPLVSQVYSLDRRTFHDAREHQRGGEHPEGFRLLANWQLHDTQHRDQPGGEIRWRDTDLVGFPEKPIEVSTSHSLHYLEVHPGGE